MRFFLTLFGEKRGHVSQQMKETLKGVRFSVVEDDAETLFARI